MGPTNRIRRPCACFWFLVSVRPLTILLFLRHFISAADLFYLIVPCGFLSIRIHTCSLHHVPSSAISIHAWHKLSSRTSTGSPSDSLIHTLFTYTHFFLWSGKKGQANVMTWLLHSRPPCFAALFFFYFIHDYSVVC